MKLRFTYKTPDVIHYGLDDAGLERNTEERSDIEEIVYDLIGEYVTIEVDTETKTATVCEKRK